MAGQVEWMICGRGRSSLLLADVETVDEANETMQKVWKDEAPVEGGEDRERVRLVRA